MKNLFKLMLLGLVVGLVFTNCKKDNDEPTVNEFETLVQYMSANDLDLATINGGFAKPGSAINVNPADYSVPDYYVMDIRQASAFETGHIKDAVNVPLANILDEAPNANGKPILVVCYSGQTAGRAVAALRMMGFEAYSLKWGMSSWHPQFAGSWANNFADITNPNWVSTGTPVEKSEFSFPTVTTSETDGADILAARVDAMLANGDWGIANADVFANPGNFFINNYWTQEHFDLFGHITGAYRIMEDLNLSGLKYLDPSKTIVTYCYTGQTSSITSAWLEVLGYDAKSLKFGVNAIAHTALLAGAPKVTWGGEGSGSNLNFGYYDKDGVLHEPLP